MNPIQRAIDTCGSQAALAAILGVRQPTVSEWLRGARPVPIERCTGIEQATSGTVMRWELRPTDWRRIWPELIGKIGAPLAEAAPASQQGVCDAA